MNLVYQVEFPNGPNPFFDLSLQMNKHLLCILSSVLPAAAVPADELLALWHFNQGIDSITSGSDFHANADFVPGRPYIEMRFADIDTNGSDGTDYTDVRGIFHDSPENNDAIRWDDIDDSGFGELWISLSTIGYKDLKLRFDVRHRDNVNSASNSLYVEYRLGASGTWNYFAAVTLIDDDSYHPRSVNFSALAAIDDQETVSFRIRPPSGSPINKDVYFDNIEITGERIPNALVQPAIVASVSATTSRLDVETDLVSQVATTVGDPTDPLATEGIVLTIVDLQGDFLTYSFHTSNSTVVPLANIDLGPPNGAIRNLFIEAAAVGYATVTLTARDPSGNETSYYVDVAATAASSTPGESRFHVFQADASTAVQAGPDHMIVADDENQTLRLYERKASGTRIKAWNLGGALGLASFQEADLEASYRAATGPLAFWMGSHGNQSDGDAAPEREVIFSIEIFNSGENSSVFYQNRYTGLKDDLLDWDNTNGHGLGAAALGLAASATVGFSPESPTGFNIEGLAAMAGTSGGAYVGFRAPLTPASGRTKALLVPVTNFESLATTGTGPASFGAPIELDLGGRGIRSISRVDSGDYLILAGPPGNTGSFELFLWDGNVAHDPVLLPTDLNSRALDADASPEALVGLPASFDACSSVQVLLDGGDLDLYGDTYRAKRHPKRNLRQFRSDFIEIPSQSDTFSVTDTGSAGPGTLRHAILCANDKPGQQTIQFDLGPGNHTISLFSEIPITDDLAIAGDPSLAVTISGTNSNRIFTVENRSVVEFSYLRLIDGFSEDDGGAVLISSGDVSFTRCEFSGHTADSRGGAIYMENAIVSIRNTTFTGCTSGANGGALNANQNTTLALLQSTLSGNASGHHGGGLFALQSDVRILNSTLVRNTADLRDGGFEGGGIRCAIGGTTTIHVGNSVIAENTDASSFGNIHPDVSGDFLSLGHNFIGIADGSTGLDEEGNNDRAGDGSSPLDPHLSNLQLNGGTMLSHKPLFNSPLIEGASESLFGDPAWRGIPPANDQRGNKRIQNAHPDIGAIEFIPIVVEVLYTDLTAAESPEESHTGSLFLTRDRSLNELDVSFGIAAQPGGAGFGDFRLGAVAPASANGGTITFPAGVNEALVTVIPVDDALIEGVEPVDIRPLDGTFHVRDTSFPVQTITIFDNDILVSNFDDSGAGTLRDAVKVVELFGGGLIQFDHTQPSGFPGPRTIELSSPINLTASTVIDGPADNAAGLTIRGGGMTGLFAISADADAILRNLTLADGAASEGGAVRVGDDASLLVENSTLIGNFARGRGGAIFSDSTDSLTLRNSTLSGNSALNDGGGIYLSSTKLTLENCTLTENLADSNADGIGYGGGLAEDGSIVRIGNTILAGNSCGSSKGAKDFAGTLSSLGGNLVGTNDGLGADSASMPPGLPNAKGDFVGTSAIPVEARLFPLNFKGGPTPVHYPGYGSPALDNGIATGSAADQRGLPRPFNGTADIGAVEHQYLDYAYWREFSFPASTKAASLYARGLDWDGDGQSNGLERLFATDPNDPTSIGRVNSLLTGNDLLVTFQRAIWVDPADVGGEASTNLNNWGTGSLLFDTGPAPDPASLHPEMRLRVPRKGDRVFGRIFDLP